MVFEFNKILENNEKILWEGKPKFLPFFLSGSIISIAGILFLILGAIVAVQGIRAGNISYVLMPHFWVGVALVFGVPIYKYLVYKHVHYAISNRRVLFQTGLIGRDFQMVDFDQITNAEVNVSLLDKLFGNSSGNILISTAGTLTYTRKGPVQAPYTLLHIDNPYEVFKFFKKVSHAVKTDIEYPNEYRPKKNPGYNTKLGI